MLGIHTNGQQLAVYNAQILRLIGANIKMDHATVSALPVINGDHVLKIRQILVLAIPHNEIDQLVVGTYALLGVTIGQGCGAVGDILCGIEIGIQKAALSPDMVS